jgi:signal transduction histidine kinase
MNSVTPVASLASTVCDILDSETQGNGAKIEGEALEDIRGAVRTIEKRSEGLIHFVNSYRSLTHIPNPEYDIVSVGELLDRVERLASAREEARHISFSKTVTPSSLEVTADSDLIEQVLINLLTNAVQALKSTEKAKIEIAGKLNQRGRVMIEISDNGPGIDKEAMNRIFIPFFTTRPDGSGIGLSFSRQVMRFHKGDITVNSDPDNRTTFTLKF